MSKNNPQKPASNANTFFIIAGALAVVVVGAVVWQRSANTTSGSAQNIDISKQPTLGNPDAKVTVVAFEDFKCPVCQRYDTDVFPNIKEKYIDTGKIRYAFFNYPFIGDDSTTAALAAECVFNQKPEKFWDFEHIVYRAQPNFKESEEWATAEYLTQIAGNVEGIDTADLGKCIEEKRYEKDVQADKDLLPKIRTDGQIGTPSVFINGKLASDNEFSTIAKAIDEALAAAESSK